MKSNHNNALPFILATVMIDSIGLGIIIPVLPQLIADTAGVSIAEAAPYSGWLFGLYAFMQFLFAPIMGGLSDQYGRRPVLLLSLLGLGVDYLLLALAPTYSWMLVGRMVSGIMGSSFTTATAYIADISPVEKRAQNFGMVGAAFGIGFVLGPGIGGLVSDLGLRAPFYISAALSLVNCIYGYFVLRETLPLDQRRPFDWKRANPLGALVQVKRYPSFGLIFLSMFLLVVAGTSLQAVWTFYTMEKFGWTARDIGWSLAAVGVCFGAVQGGLTGVAVKKLGHKRAIFVGLFSFIFGLLCIGFASASWVLYASMIPYALGGFFDPSVRASVSEKVPANEQGELQGSFTSFFSLAEIIAPPMMSYIYYTFATGKVGGVELPGMPFIFGAVLGALCIPLVMVGLRRLAAMPTYEVKEEMQVAEAEVAEA